MAPSARMLGPLERDCFFAARVEWVKREDDIVKLYHGSGRLECHLTASSHCDIRPHRLWRMRFIHSVHGHAPVCAIEGSMMHVRIAVVGRVRSPNFTILPSER